MKQYNHVAIREIILYYYRPIQLFTQVSKIRTMNHDMTAFIKSSMFTMFVAFFINHSSNVSIEFHRYKNKNKTQN